MSACQKSTHTYLDFKQTTNIFSQQIESFVNHISKLWLFWETSNQISLHIKWENKDFKLDSNINLSGFINYFSNDKDLHNQFFVYFWDKKEQKETKLSWNLDYKSAKNQQFVHLQDFFVNLWSGNYQNNLILLISKQLENKRLLLEQKTPYTHAIHQDIVFLLQSIISSDIFYSIQTVKYNSFLAYKIKIKPEMLDYINKNTNTTIKDFEWLLIVKSNWDVNLKIDNLDIFYHKDFNIKWDIGDKNWSINIKQKEKESVYFNFSWNFYKNQYHFVLKQMINYQEIIKINISLTNKLLNNTIKNQINWNILISPQIIYWTDLEKEIKIDINGEQKVKIQIWHSFDKPTSYVIFKQILWDEFSLDKIMSEENSFTTINNE